ncbi:unnamed protein product [Ectocarpus fasciculatus]
MSSHSLPPINPFVLPADDQIFTLREEFKAKKEQEREMSKTMKVWEKKGDTVKSTTQRLAELVGETKPAKLSDLQADTATNAKLLAARRQEKENMIEFIAKKREMFLVQMSLDTKREEIRKLEEKAQMKEEALERSEQMLEEDAMRFDAFLKENDKKAHDAIKKAEEETKKKQEKALEIKRLTQQIQALSSEMSKHKEALEDCLRYKAFLDKLTPPEWFEQHNRTLEEERRAKQKKLHDKRMKEWDHMRRRMIEQHKKEVDARKEASKKDSKRNHHEDDEDTDSPRLNIPLPPKLEDEVVEVVDREPEMYFSDPQQLMDIFSALEEQNLFLIQNSQETEHTLEELRQAYKTTKVTMDARTGQLQAQIDELEGLIQLEEQRTKLLHAKRMAAAESTGEKEKERLLGDLHAKVKNVYEQCGFDASTKPSTLFMLSQLESKLESLLTEISGMPQDYVIRAEKEKEKKRRERKREEQQALQERLQEERNKRAIERSLQAPKKRAGRQVMFRSKPVRRARENTDDANNLDNNDEAKYLS